MRNLSMLMDFYELTMANGYYELGLKDEWVVFDLFYRKNPDNGGFVIAAGLQQAIEYLQNLHFSEDDIAFLRAKGIFSEGFLAYLKDLKFSGNVYGVKEGTIVYPNIPILTIEAPLCEAQIVETMLLLTINHQSMIATKANRIVRAAKGRAVMEFGARRAQGYDGAVYGTRACYIGGVGSTATVMADQMFDVPSVGTMAHSWVQYFDNEYEAFKAYAKIYPNNCVLLVDTYDTLKSGAAYGITVPHTVAMLDRSEKIKVLDTHPQLLSMQVQDNTLNIKLNRQVDKIAFSADNFSNSSSEYRPSICLKAALHQKVSSLR